MQLIDSPSRDSCGSQCSKAVGASSSCKSTTPPAVITPLRHQLPFARWQAGRLLYLDLQYLAWQTFTYIMYGLKTTMLLCGHTSVVSTGHPENCAAATSAYEDWIWGFACNGLSSNRRSWSVGVPGLLIIRSALMNTVRAAVGPVLAGWMMSDYGIGLSLIVMAAWILTIFTPSLCRAYIKHRWLRCSLLLLHRYTKLIGCWMSLGVLLEEHLATSLMGYFLTIGQFAFSGWQNAMTLVPFKLFVVCGLVEWLMLCGIIHGVKQTYPTAAAGITAHSSSFLYLLSFLLVYLVPLVITAAVEYRQKQQYSECTVRPVAAAGEQQQPQQQRVQQGGRSQSQSSCSAYTQDEHRAAFTERTTTDATTTSSCCVDSHADTSPGTTAAAAEALTVGQDSSTGSLSSPAGPTPSAHCLSEPATADLLPRLRLLLGESTLQHLINDLQNNTTSATAAGPPVHYQGLCTVTNASIKVSTDHCSVSTLAPLLQSSLMTTVAADTSAAAALHSACFQGCVQLLGLMYFPRRQQQQRAHEQQHHAESVSELVGCTSQGAASDLLHQVKMDLAAAAGRATDSRSAVQLSEAAAAAVSVSWAGSFTERADDSHTDQQQQPCCGHTQHKRQQRWWKRLSLNVNARSATHTAGADKQETEQSHGVDLLYSSPMYITVGQSTRLRLQLSGVASPTTSSEQHRLLVFTGSSVLVSALLKVQSVVDVEVPAVCQAGVMHVCLVPTQGSLQQQVTAVTHQALLVLPAAAAEEVQRVWRQCGTADEQPEQHQQQLHVKETWKAMAALSADIAYLLGSSTPSSSSSSSPCQLAPEKAAVLKHVLVFLAQHQCWQLMQFVVDATAAAVAAPEGSTMAVAAAPQASLNSGKTQAGSVSEQCKLTSTALDSGGGNSSSKDSGTVGRAMKHQSSPGTVVYNEAAEVSAVLPHTALCEHAAECEAAAQDSTSADCLNTNRQGWRAQLSRMLPSFYFGGIRSPCIPCAPQQTPLSTVTAVVYHLGCVLALRLLGSQLQRTCQAGPMLCARQGEWQPLYKLLLVTIGVGLVVGRTTVISRGRRDVAALFLEVCLYVMRLLSSAGILRLGPDLTRAYHRDGWMALAVIWAGVMLHRSGCNQVRMRLLLLPLLVESFAALH